MDEIKLKDDLMARLARELERPVLQVIDGRWCVSNGLANKELGNWFCEVIEFDDAYKTFTACSYEKNKKYFYKGRKVLNEWLGWEKYTPVS